MEFEEEQETKEEVTKEDLNEYRNANLNIQQFMSDMHMLGKQVNDKDLVKPTFHYGDLSITNYLLWLILGELT